MEYSFLVPLIYDFIPIFLGEKPHIFSACLYKPDSFRLYQLFWLLYFFNFLVNNLIDGSES